MMIRVRIEGVVLDLKSNLPIIVLRDEKQRVLPISVGIFEAQAITFALEGIRIPRPLTHDLLKSLIEKLGAKLVRVEITGLKGNTYFAHLIIKSKDGEEIQIDSRPSDAIAVALRLRAPIYTAQNLLIAKKISSRPISNIEVKRFKEIIERMTPDDIWKQLKRKK